MSIDLKTILLIALIVIVLGVIFVFAIGYLMKDDNTTQDVAVPSNETSQIKNNTNTEKSKSQNYVVIKKEDTGSSNNNVRTQVFTNTDLTQIYGTGLSINNSKPKTEYAEESFFSSGFSMEGNTKAIFYVPNGWTRNEKKYIDPITGATLECVSAKTEEFVKQVYNETTYEDVINAFIENQRIIAIYPDDIEFSIKQLETEGGTFPIVVKRDGFIVTSYIIFIKGLYEYHLQVTTSLEDYSIDMQKTIDDIFRSYKIL
jgi:hypothetical protein